MSRSFKKTPIIGNSCAESEKEDKVHAHKKFRKKTKNKLREIEKTILDESDDILPEKLEEVSDVWTFAKDGRQIATNKRDLRK